MRGTAKTVALLGVAAVLAAGCAKPAPSTPATTAKFKACMVTDIGGINDKSFNQSSWAGVQAAAVANPNITAKFLPSTSSADYARNISTFESLKCGIIVTVGFLMGPATQSAALASPSQHFAIVDCSYASFCLSTKPHPPIAHNIKQLVFNTSQDAFLGGYLAAGMTKTGVVATYGGAQFGTVTIYEDGFWQGVQYYNSKHHTHVKVLGWNYNTQKGIFVGGSNPFGDQAAGARIANSFISAHADVIFPVAGGDGLGTAAAVKAADASGKHVNMYWVDTDGCVSAASYCQYFITSVEKGLAEAVKTAVLQAASGHFSGSTYVGTLANGGAVLAPFHAPWTTKVPASLQAELAQIAAGIKNGTIPTPTKNPV